MRGRRTEPERIDRLRGVMRRRNIGALLVTTREDIRYLTGFTGSSGNVLITPRTIVLITDFRYQVQSAREARGIKVVIQKKDLLTAVRETAAQMRATTLWFDEASLSVERARILRRTGLRLRGIADPIAELRQRKDRVELGRIRKAIERAEAAFHALRRGIKPGVKERDLGLRLEFLMRAQGARKAAFDSIVASGPNGAMPHATVSDRRLRSGDLLTIDFGAESDGYFCDITRTICVGRPSGRQRQIHGLVLRAQEAAIRAIAPKRRFSVVDAAARDIIGAAGHAAHFGHATGHGVGLAVHEGPTLSGQSKGNLEPGMVVTVEPGVYIPGWGGVRIEDMVLVTERGHTVLSTLSREL
jgi:Xaa-Pro aminopeptidase